jgi:hypothetical protein
VDDEIRQLKNKLYSARSPIVDLMPKDIADLLQNHRGCESRADTYKWQSDVVDTIIDKAIFLPERVSYSGVQRAYCPLCRDGSQGPYDEGFAISEGLRRHLIGWGNVRQCRVTDAAFALASEYWDSTVEEAERRKRAAASEEKARRREVEILYKNGPHEEPTLFEERCWLGDVPRTEEEFQWAEQRLTQLGFSIKVDERVRSYLKEYSDCTIFADPRATKKITFYVYPKKATKSRRGYSPVRHFFIMDSWKHDLVKKFEDRFRMGSS